MPSLEVLFQSLRRDIMAAYLYVRTTLMIKRCHLRNNTLMDLFKRVVQKNRHKTCFIFEDEEWTYGKVNAVSNQIAHVFLAQGFSKGDTVALLMENCPDYVCIWLGLAKIGVITAFINTNIRDEGLAHSINVVDAKAVIFGANFDGIVKDASKHLNCKSMQYYCYYEEHVKKDAVIPPNISLNALLEEASTTDINHKKFNINFDDKVVYIYTSGTTGLPKAAVIRHCRYFFLGIAANILSQLSSNEVYYNCLPLYHSAGGLLFISSMFCYGGKMIIRKKFSASNFWKDAVKYNATVTQYIGEICRYLLNQPKRPEETQHSLRLFFGNGLRPNLWQEFQSRFKIPRIIEIYGATEGNANLVNIFGKPGAVGFLPVILDMLYPVNLIKVHPETGVPMRNEDGLCIRCKPGEPGEIVGKVVRNPINRFDGYANAEETKKKIIHDCFSKGDTAFRSGDILVKDKYGYLYFLDRSGDTFRWKGENVSTTEVENAVSKAMNHESCVIYGVAVPNCEGRAGMAAVQSDVTKLNFTALYERFTKALPLYAVPLFLRICTEMESTGTYKLRKVSYQEDGIDPEKVSDPLFMIDYKNKTYLPMTKELYLNIVDGLLKL